MSDLVVITFAKQDDGLAALKHIRSVEGTLGADIGRYGSRREGRRRQDPRQERGEQRDRGRRRRRWVRRPPGRARVLPGPGHRDRCRDRGGDRAQPPHRRRPGLREGHPGRAQARNLGPVRGRQDEPVGARRRGSAASMGRSIRRASVPSSRSRSTRRSRPAADRDAEEGCVPVRALSRNGATTISGPGNRQPIA